jgi:hypothetical protein
MTMRRSNAIRTRWVALCALWLGSACLQAEGKLTEVVVTVDADDSVAANLTSIELTIYDADQTGARVEPVTSGVFALNTSKKTSGAVEFPFSFGIRKNKADRFLLVVTGYAGEEAVIEQKARVAFVKNELRGLGIYLRAPCYQQLCGGVDADSWLANTCNTETGACGEVPILQA